MAWSVVPWILMICAEQPDNVGETLMGAAETGANDIGANDGEADGCCVGL